MMFQDVKRALSLTLAAAGMLCVAGTLAATPTNVTYTASGNFASPPLKGADMLKLAGQPLSMSVVAPIGLKPTKTGTGYAVYSNLSLTATLYSGLLPGVPVTVTNSTTSLYLQIGQNYDTIKINTQVSVLNINLSITAMSPMAKGTITTLKIAPFKNTVMLTSPKSILVYSDTTAFTALGINGTLTGTASASTTLRSAAPVFRPGPEAAAIFSRRYEL
jgi:hypothetical protein